MGLHNSEQGFKYNKTKFGLLYATSFSVSSDTALRGKSFWGMALVESRSWDWACGITIAMPALTDSESCACRYFCLEMFCGLCSDKDVQTEGAHARQEAAFEHVQGGASKGSQAVCEAFPRTPRDQSSFLKIKLRFYKLNIRIVIMTLSIRTRIY